MHRIFQLLIGLLVGGAVFTGVEYFMGKRRKLLRRDWKLDLFYFFFTPTIGKTVSQYLLLAAAVPVYIIVLHHAPTKELILRGYGPVSRQPLWIQTIELMIIADFIGYWSHRWLHYGWQWKMHAVHHSSEELDWLSSVREHPFNEAAMEIARFIPLVLVGFSPAGVALLTPFLTIYAIMIHANVNWTYGPLKYVVASPVFHRWHHTMTNEGGNKNFSSLFPIWDILFGTFYMPRGRFPEKFGTDRPMKAGFVSHMLFPLRK